MKCAKILWPCVFGILTAACTPSPEKTCAHLATLKKTAAAREKEDEGVVEKRQKKCLSRLTRMQEDYPDLYKCTAKCIVKAKTNNDAMSCKAACK